MRFLDIYVRFWKFQEVSQISNMLQPGSGSSEGGETLITLIAICHAQWLLEAGNIRLQIARGGE